MKVREREGEEESRDCWRVMLLRRAASEYVEESPLPLG